jgi:hypothetical protein
METTAPGGRIRRKMVMRKLLVILLAVTVLAAGLAVVPASAASGNMDQFKGRRGVCKNAIFLGKQPAVKQLAKRVKVSYDQALTWVCQGWGAGEILFAYRVSKAAGVSMDQIFTQRNQGMNWNSIVTFYDIRNNTNFNNNFPVWMLDTSNNNMFPFWWRMRVNQNGRIVVIRR